MQLRDATAPIRFAAIEELLDPKALEALLIKVGIRIPMVSSDQLPASWTQADETLPAMYQCPNQLAAYLTWLRTQPIKSYLEVGLNDGLQFAVTVEYLDRFKPLQRAIGFDIRVKPALREYLMEDSRLSAEECSSASAIWPTVDFAFIDADHRYEAVRMDLLMAFGANIPRIALHDIVDWGCPGVRLLWREIQNAQIQVLRSFAEQPSPNVMDKLMMGIGVIAKQRNTCRMALPKRRG